LAIAQARGERGIPVLVDIARGEGRPAGGGGVGEAWDGRPFTSTSWGARERAAGVLQNLTCNIDLRVRVVAAGAVGVLVGMLRLGDCTDTAREAAAGALWNLMIDNGPNRAAVIASGGATALVDLVRDVRNDAGSEAALTALWQLIYGRSQRAVGGNG